MKCLKCGREIEQGKTFCAQCRASVSEPLRESAFVNTQIILPTRTPQISAKKAEQKKERKRRPWALMTCTVLLALLCLSLLLQGLYYMHTRAQLQTELDAAQQALSEAKSAEDFLSKQVVFIQSDGTNCFHSHDCPSFTRRDYWAYALYQARNLGYQPCPLCQP